MSPAPPSPERTTPPDDRSRLETLLARFEQEWRDGKRPAIDAFLNGLPDALRDWLLLELVHTELEHRLKAGQPARVEEYLDRYPRIAARPAALRDLVAAEVRLRLRTEPGLTPDEYRRRFPGQVIALAAFAGMAPARDAASTPAAAGNGMVAETLHLPTDHPTAPAPSGPPGRQVPGYEIVGELGRGGMGVVYKARHLALGRVVALKMILDGRDAGPEGLARFRAEAQALARLQHPNIVQIHEIGAHDGRPYFSLEYVEGSSLDKKLTGAGVPPRQAAQIVETLARAVDVAHRAGVIHRDLKPANVLVGPRWTLKVTDFGLAKRLDEDSGRTRAGQVMGTPSYMAPEQAGAAKAVGPAADVYALGAILYELLTGRPPFRGASVMETLRQVLTRDPAPPRRLRPATPADLETICLKCLEKRPEGRYAGAAALADDLRRFLDGLPVQARPVGRLGRAVKWARRNPALAVTAGLAAFAVLTAAVASSYFLLQKAAAETALTTKDQALQSTAQKASETEGQLTEAQRREREKAAAIALERLKKGVALCQETGSAEGLPLLADALQIAPPGADRDHLREVIRRNLAAWGGPVGPLLYPMKDAAVALSPDGRTAMASTYHAREWDKTVLLDVATGAVLADDLPAAGLRGAGRFCADGRFVVTGLTAYRRWDARTGKPAGPECGALLRGASPYGLGSSAAGADGGSVLGVGTDGRLYRWRLTTGETVGQPVTLPQGENLVAANPDAPTFITYDQQTIIPNSQGARLQRGPARFRSAADGTTIGDPIPFGSPDAFATYSADGQSVLLVGYLGDESGDIQRMVALGFIGRVYETATGRLSSPDLNLNILNAGNGASNLIRTAQFRPDKRAVWVATDAYHGWWDVATGKRIGALRRFPEPVVSAALSADGHTILAGTPRGVRVWDADGEDEVAGSPVCQYDNGGLAAFSPDGTAVAVVEQVSDDAHARYRGGVWEAATGAAVGRPTPVPASLGVFAPGGNTLVTLARPFPQKPFRTSPPALLRFWDARRGNERRFRLPGSGVLQGGRFDIACSRDGRRWAALTSSSERRQLQVYELPAEDASPPGRSAGGDDPAWEDARPIAPPIPLPAPASGVALSPDGRAAAAATSNGAYLWSADDGKPLGASLFIGEPVQFVTFSGDGKSLMTTEGTSIQAISKVGDVRRRSQVWKVGADPAVALGQPLKMWAAGGILLSGDGRTAVEPGRDGLQLWDVESAVPVGRPLGFHYHQYYTVACTFAPDGRELLAALRRQYVPNASESTAPLSIDAGIFTGLEVRRLRVPGPLAGAPETLKLWSEVVAGAEVDDQGAVHALDAPTLAERRRRLAGLGDFLGK